MMIFPQVGWGNNAYKSWFHLSVRSLYPSSLLMNKSLAAMNGALGSCSPLLLLFAAFRGNFLCPLRGSNSFLQMWGNLSAPGVAAHPCTKQGWEKWEFLWFFFFAILSVPQQVSACPLIQRSTLANSVAAYYGNFMCTIHDLMQACYVNRKRLFHCTVIESYRGDVKTCWAALLHRNTNIYQQQRDAATFFFLLLYLQTRSVFHVNW